jgi:hypothetical protein
METSMDKRKTWRAQEQELVARWNAAVARMQDPLEADSARSEIDALRREVARLKVAFNSGKRY